VPPPIKKSFAPFTLFSLLAHTWTHTISEFLSPPASHPPTPAPAPAHIHTHTRIHTHTQTHAHERSLLVYAGVYTSVDSI